jgi:hypothetical protein
LLKHAKVLVRKSEESRPFESPIHRWEDNIKIHFLEIRCEYVDCVCAVHDKDPPVAGYYEDDNEYFISMKSRKFVYHLSSY